MAHTALLSLAMFLSASRVYGSHLPFYVGNKAKSSSKPWATKEMFRLGDRVYHEPSAWSGLSRKVSDYYYTVGSASALTDELRQHRVGGSGRLHILHLPGGTDGLEMTERRGNRRSSFTALTPMSEGLVLHFPFPKYELSANYSHPNDESHQAKEKSAVESITPDLTMGFLKALLDNPTRSYNNPEGSAKAQKFLQSSFNTMGLKTCLQKFTKEEVGLANVIGTIPGKSASTVTIGAHYDSRPFEGAAPGAEDNGSGVAALLAIAKAFSEAKIVPHKTINFVAFAAEEPGLLGSAYYAQNLEKSGGLLQNKNGECSNIVGSFLQQREPAKHNAIVMDEVGWKSPKCSLRSVNLEAYDWAGDVMSHLRHSSAAHNGDELEVVHSNNPFGSDHMSFLEREMHGVLTINCDDEGYPNYHKSTDSIENIDPQLLTMVTKMNLGALFRMAGKSP